MAEAIVPVAKVVEPTSIVTLNGTFLSPLLPLTEHLRLLSPFQLTIFLSALTPNKFSTVKSFKKIGISRNRTWDLSVEEQPCQTRPDRRH